jgi:endonuclease YncB( thermonuclease family)
METSMTVWTMPAMVDRVIDGDTIVVHMQFMPGKELHGEHVRVQGINAPELSQAGGAEARDYARGLLPIESPITLVMSKEDKYGRCLAKIIMADGRDFGDVMLAAGQAVPYMA